MCGREDFVGKMRDPARRIPFFSKANGQSSSVKVRNRGAKENLYSSANKIVVHLES